MSRDLERGTSFGEIMSDSDEHSAVGSAPITALASAMLFGTVTFATTCLAARAYMAGDMRAIRVSSSPSRALNSTFASVYTLLYHSTIFGLILFYAYLCENHPPYPHSIKSYDRDEFLFLIVVIVVTASSTVMQHNSPQQRQQQRQSQYPSNRQSAIMEEEERDDDGVIKRADAANDILNRYQTEEWKGWMQFIFLLYNYYQADEAYNAMRVLFSSYVWMTGYGHFSFFYAKEDYSAIRVLQTLWRLNFLVVFLCLTQGTTLILYYVCLLHTYYFLVVYATMRIGQPLNYKKWGLRAKLAVVAVGILLVWDFNSGLFRLVHFPLLGEVPMLGASSGSMYEWYFRSSLDHWSTYLGMVFALNYPISSLFFRKVEAQSRLWEVLAKGAVGCAMLGALYVWLTGPFQQSKVDYNQTNAYFGFIPILTYIFWRNLTPWLRSHSLRLLQQIGTTSLETYLMQHHIWLTSNAQTLLTVVPGWPKVNMIVVTVMFVLVSGKLHQLTLYLRGIVLPNNNKQQCFRNLAFLAIVIAGFYAMALALRAFGIMSLCAIGLVSVVCGFLLYQYVMDLTWDGFKQAAMANRTPTTEETMLEKMVGEGAGAPKYDSFMNTVSAPVMASMVLLILGLTWHGMSQVAATRIGPLPSTCEEYVNDGVWIPIDPCNEESRGAGYRDYGITSFATCAAKESAYVWGWKETHPSTHCRFTVRDSTSIRKAVNYRTITFIGDSITRNLYQAFLRQMGIAGAGAYNTKGPKWADINNRIGSTVVEFEWAALAKDEVPKLKDVITRPEKETDKSSARPDLVVMGGGAWDRLHVFTTDEDRESHRATVKALAKEIRFARSEGIPVVWVVPTTINTPALLTEEKRKNIKEEDMAAMRALYDSLGIPSSSSFVLDGPSFTSSRVEESYDGVHYPLAVYDAGAQILANALDWLLPDPRTDPFVPPGLGKMANPPLGFMVICFVFMGLFCFDGFLGFSYLAAFFGNGIMPSDLCDEAFGEYHDRLDAEAVGGDEEDDYDDDEELRSLGASTLATGSRVSGGTMSSRDRSQRSGRTGRSNTSGRSDTSGRSNRSSRSSRSGKSNDSGRSSTGSRGSIDEEIAALLGTTSKRLEMKDLGNM